MRLVNDEEDEWSGEDEDDQEELARLRKEVVTLRGRWLVLCSSCSNDNPNSAETGRVVRVLRTKANSRGTRKTVIPVTETTKTLHKSGGNQTEEGGQ